MRVIVHLLIAAQCIVSFLSVRAENPVLLSTFPNPTPEANDNFSRAVAALGNDRLLIGIPFDGPTNGGAVYLFSTNGVLLKTFANPDPSYESKGWLLSDGDWFGSAIAGVGTDRVLIGAPYEGPFYSGRVYLFSTNGSLLTTLGSPSEPYVYDSFGYSVAGLGDNRLIVGAPEHTTDPDTGMGVGVAYLFSTNGTLLATFENPDTEHLRFGWSVAAFGTDRLIIGAPGSQYGAAFLFDTNGTLLMTFTNSSQTDGFGYSVATIGNDRLFVGAREFFLQTLDTGAAYVFNTNGTMLATCTNPSPAASAFFGSQVAVLGNDRLVVSSIQTEAAYLFSTNGTLLNTITNPTPAASDNFGSTVAALGNNRVIIGATHTDTRHAENVGTAYLFSIPPTPAPAPSLAVRRTTTNAMIVSWPSPSTGFVLQQNTNRLGSVSWSNFTGTIQDNGTSRSITVNPAAGNCFYRLFKP